MTANDWYRLILVLMGAGVIVLIIIGVVVWNLLSRGMDANRVRRRTSSARARREDRANAPRSLAPPPPKPVAVPAAPPPPPLPARGERYCYDKARYHEAMVPPELPIERSLVATGLYLAWTVEAGLASRLLLRQSADEVAVLRNREAAPWRLYHVWEGSLDDDMLSDEGNAFTRRYFDLSGGGHYENDFKSTLAKDLATPFQVEGSWDQYDRLKTRLDGRLAAWRKAQK